MLEQLFPSFCDELEKIAAAYVRIDVRGGGKELQHHYLRVDRWGSPAGAIEKGETPLQAAARELQERTGYAVDHEHLRSQGVDGDFHVFSTSIDKIKKVGKPQTEIRFAKTAASIPQKVDAHLKAEIKDWRAFEKNLRSPRFAAEIRSREDADDKLKKYVTANNEYLKSKNIVTTVASRTSSKKYEVRRLKSGRLGCGCGDWQYKHSWKGTDCDHVQMAKRGGG